jgi:23S rRNA pseudouridine2605 synthase
MSEIIRLNAFLSRCGVCSRRRADEYITCGRVKVNGSIVSTLGAKIEIGRDTVFVDGKEINPPPDYSYYVFNKPVNVVTSMRDPQGRKTIDSYIADIGIRLFPVGRLDYDSEGLLLLTNDGELSHRIQHPRYKIPKEYMAEIDGILSDDMVSEIKEGVMLEDGPLNVIELDYVDSTPGGGVYRILIAVGRKRIIRRLFGKFGYRVTMLKRIAIGEIRLGELAPGRWRELSMREIEYLKKSAGLL